RAPGASVLPHRAPLRTAPESGDARVVRRNPRHAQPAGRARGAPHRSRLGGHHGVTDRRHPSRPRRGGNARALRGADPDAYREGRRVPPPLGQGLLLGDGGERVGMVPVVFGVFGVVLAGLDFWRFGWPPADRHAWWFAHMRGMLGSYIATVTAFSVVNFTFLPTAVRWLWPIVVGTPLIAAWITYYRLRFRRGTSAPVQVGF